jgi:16S rRNA (cytosine1402-N4)-methyltransferase
MVREILEVLPLKAGSTVVDGTLGLGGHSLRFAEAIWPGGRLVGMDWDSSMLEIARERLRGAGEMRSTDITVELHHTDFRNIASVVPAESADGILLDLALRPGLE